MRNQTFAPMLRSKLALLLLSLIFIYFFAAGNLVADSGTPGNINRNIDDAQRLTSDSFKHIVLTWQDDPENSQAVTWRTNVKLEPDIAEIAESSSSPDFGNSAKQYIAESSTLKTINGLKYYHSVNFSKLLPDTAYAYRVGNGEVWSEWLQFRTAAGKNADFSFIYLGDAQHKIHSLWSRTIRAAVLEAPRARFVIHTGDMVDDPNSDQQWDEWFRAGSWIMAMIPNVPVAGNHEYTKRGALGPTLSAYWKYQFALPAFDRRDLDETVYHIDFQGVRIIVLNSNRQIKYQANWLENVLADNPNRWTVIAAHHPVYSSAKRRSNKHLKKYWKPVFEKYRVDLVLQGHDHVYARGRGPCPTGDTCRGPMYVTSVSGPGMYRLDGRNWMDRSAENMQLFQIISISENKLGYKSFTVSGDVFDEFELTK